MRKAKAFAPSHITGIFEIFDESKNELEIGSRGAGFSLSKGIVTTVKVEESKEFSLEIMINGSVSNSAEVSKRVVEIFLSKFKNIIESSRIVIEHQVEVPIGAGFGTSGAAALSLALALNELFKLGMTGIEAAQIAHVAEVECKTGLGTVIAETFGGVEIRIKPGAPGVGEIRHIPVEKDIVAVSLIFGPLSTKKFLTDEAVRRRVNELGGKLINKLIEEPSITNFMKFSRQFAEHVGLITEKLKHILKVMDQTGFIFSMPMFGEAIFTLVEKDTLPQLFNIFNMHNLNGKIIVSEIDFKGARLLS